VCVEMKCHRVRVCTHVKAKGGRGRTIICPLGIRMRPAIVAVGRFGAACFGVRAEGVNVRR